MSTLFTKIINQDIPSYKIKENNLFYAFLDIRPISEGHTLVIPKIEIDHFFDLDEKYLAEILNFSKPIVKAIEKSIPCLRVGSLIAGTEVPHAHLHLVPIINIEEFSFKYAKPASSESLTKTQKKLCQNLD